MAAVYINRLRRRMKLESDPTTIYGITQGKVPLNRELTRADLQSNTPYNTYVVTGLPPGPICNPGRAAILAATNPARDRALYFVADGQGGHAFAGTLAEHNRNVERWRQIQRERAEQQQQRRRRRARPARRPRRLPASSVRRRDREPCRPASWRWSSLPSSPSASPGSCAPTRPRWRAGCAWCWSCWAPSASAAMLIFGLRFLPSLLPELFGLAGLVITGADRARAAQPAVRRLQLARHRTAHRGAHGVPAGLDRPRHG